MNVIDGYHKYEQELIDNPVKNFNDEYKDSLKKKYKKKLTLLSSVFVEILVAFKGYKKMLKTPPSEVIDSLGVLNDFTTAMRYDAALRYFVLLIVFASLAIYNECFLNITKFNEKRLHKYLLMLALNIAVIYSLHVTSSNKMETVFTGMFNFWKNTLPPGPNILKEQEFMSMTKFGEQTILDFYKLYSGVNLKLIAYVNQIVLSFTIFSLVNASRKLVFVATSMHSNLLEELTQLNQDGLDIITNTIESINNTVITSKVITSKVIKSKVIKSKVLNNLKQSKSMRRIN